MKSTRIDSMKKARYVRWGMTRGRGTWRGKLKKVGRRAVRTGMESVRLEKWGWSRIFTSLVLSMVVKQARKRVHSRRMLTRLVTLIGRP